MVDTSALIESRDLNVCAILLDIRIQLPVGLGEEFSALLQHAVACGSARVGFINQCIEIHFALVFHVCFNVPVCIVFGYSVPDVIGIIIESLA